MQDFVLSTGIAAEKVRLIPIGINLSMFPLVSQRQRTIARERLGLREDDIVIGSFQKDGEGWGEGSRPKLIKGPDVFVETVARLKKEKSRVHILLTGPARGYVKKELALRDIPFTHTQVARYSDMSVCYHALDLMLVTSREEGGPKSVLESMACGIPLVSTKVGQAADLIRHGENAWMVEVEDVDGLCSYSLMALEQNRTAKALMVRRGRETAEKNDYKAQLPLWDSFFENFVESNI
jgi:glycosyltransferase involved in cell wall biosynthesis